MRVKKPSAKDRACAKEAARSAEASARARDVPYNAAQVLILAHIADRAESFVIAGVGLGKSRAVLGAAPLGLVVVAPAKVAKMAWPYEIAKWSALPHYDTTKPAARRAWSRGDAGVYVVAYDSFASLADLGPPPVDTLVYDESHALKSPSTQRSFAIRGSKNSSSGIGGKFARVIAMTATPRPNGAWDLFNQVRHVDGGRRLGYSYTAFEKRYFDVTVNGDHIVTLRKAKSGAEAEIYEQIRDMTLALKQGDYADIQPYVLVDIPVTLPPEARRAYEQMKKQCLMELSACTITAAGAMGIVGKLTQITGGFIYDSEKRVHQIHSAKLDALKKLNTENTLTITRYIHEREAVVAQGAVQLVPSVVDAWNLRQIPHMVSGPVAGLNLQTGGSRLVWHSLPWSSVEYEQTNGRLHRPGQAHVVTIFRLIAEDTIDETIAEVLRRKLTSTDDMLEILKNTL